MDHDLILRFPDRSNLQDFLERVGRERPDILGQCRSSKVQEGVLTTRNMDADQAQWLRCNLPAVAKVYENFTMQPFST